MRRGRKKGYKKPDAWINSPQADAAADYYKDGHSVRETAERFRVTKSQVNNLAMARGLSNGRSFRECAKDNGAVLKAEAEKQIAKRLLEFGLEYLGGYTGKDSKVRVRFLRCGHEAMRSLYFLKTASMPVCKECAKQEADLQREKRKREKHESNKRIAVCDVCGGKFITYNPQQKRCSSKCSHAFKNRKKDRRLTQANIVDNNITLPRLYERDGGFCYICGLKCSWDDMAVRDDGVLICGPTYPTIDHVFPLAKGGEHSWKNVKLAHWACNIRKSDNITDGVADGAEVIASGRIFSKKTLQYDLEGNLISVYLSTKEAAEATGFKRKQIQNCARGEMPTYRGYVWKYA